jgi:hypothetical protein
VLRSLVLGSAHPCLEDLLMTLMELMEAVAVLDKASAPHGLQYEVLASFINALVPDVTTNEVNSAVAAGLIEWDILI